MVDDDPSICELVRLLLSDDGGPEVITARHWREALPVLTAARPSLVLVEVSPGHGGLELVRRVRSDQTLRPLPVVAFGCDRSCRLKALDEGCDAWLDKPFDTGDLEATVQRHLQAQ